MVGEGADTTGAEATTGVDAGAAEGGVEVAVSPRGFVFFGAGVSAVEDAKIISSLTLKSGRAMGGRTKAGTTESVVDEVSAVSRTGGGEVVTPPEKTAMNTPVSNARNIPRYGERRDMFKGYYQVSRDTITCLHVIVRGERREEGCDILNVKMVFSPQRGISLMVERQFSKLRAGVRFSYPALE